MKAQRKGPKRLTILMLFIALFLVSSCRKDKSISYCNLHPEDCVDIQEVKKYFYFKEGSYWVYQEQNSGLIDSVYVFETYNDPSTYYFSTKLYSSYDGYYYRFWPKIGAVVDSGLVEKSKRSTIIYKSKAKPGDFVSESECFLFYPKIGDWTYSDGGYPYGYNNKLTVSDIYDSIGITNKIFFEAITLYEEHTASEEKQSTFHYYVKTVGLVKKELIDSNQIWDLINYNIVQ